MPRTVTAAAVLVAAALAAPAHAAPGGFADLVAIDNAVAAFTGQPIGVPGGASLPVDRRLRLAACAAPLALSWRGQSRDSVVVECPVAGGWHLYVPVAGGNAGRQEPAAIAVQKGEQVTVAVTGEGFSVSQPGEALDQGAVGAWIRVRTSAKADPVRAQVVRPGLVQLPVD